MLEEKEKLLRKNLLFNLRKNKKEATAYEKAKTLLCIVAVFLSISIISLIYFLSNASNIYHISVEGNVYLNKEDVIRLSGLSDDHKFLFSFPFVVERKLKQSSIIDDCKVSLEDGRLVKIMIKEKKVVGYALENGLYVLIMNDDSRLSLNEDNLYLISKVPLIEGFNKEELVLIEKKLGNCDYEIIDLISEIHNYPMLKYQNLELIMADGNYIFTSAYGLDILNKYYDIKSSYVTEHKQCYYFEDISGNAYSSACPWQESQESENTETEQSQSEKQEESDNLEE